MSIGGPYYGTFGDGTWEMSETTFLERLRVAFPLAPGINVVSWQDVKEELSQIQFDCLFQNEQWLICVGYSSSGSQVLTQNSVFVDDVWLHRPGVHRIRTEVANNAQPAHNGFSSDFEFVWSQSQKGSYVFEEQQGHDTTVQSFIPNVTFDNSTLKIAGAHLWGEHITTSPQDELENYIKLAKKVILCSSQVPETPHVPQRQRPRISL
jgi:hypothetical protein